LCVNRIANLNLYFHNLFFNYCFLFTLLAGLAPDSLRLVFLVQR
jgi:hypothetical protein